MDAELDRRWRESQPPFDGLTITLKDYIPLPLFQKALVAVVERLYTYRPEASLCHNMDWHEHDGFISESQPIPWKQLRDLVASIENIQDRFYLADTYVRDGIFPAERDYLLRYYVDFPDATPWEPTPLPTGIMDVTCQRPLTLQLKDVLQATGVSNLEILPAKAFFDTRYTG
ncbi:MAG: hypothetical protein JWN14_3955 [Chthonomonadales bacterium]|nr:hypothetical protein [Chthonomonadales bacterium]